MSVSSNLIHQLSTDLRRLEELENYLNHVRRVDEGAGATLIRLIDERARVVDLLTAAEIKSQSFDYTYKHTFKSAVDELQKLLMEAVNE